MTTSAPPTLDDFGARMALVRWAHSWNMKQAAMECGIPQNTWMRYEKVGGPNIYGIAEQISARTGYPLAWLLGLDKSSPCMSDLAAALTSPFALAG